ncbi:MAG: hypothetical protein ACTSUO_04580 [Candidatus Thorarchaeota archaeon]
MSDGEMDIEAIELDQIYGAMSILGIDKEATDAYLFLLKEGASPIERIPISPHKKMRILQLLVAKKLVTASRGGQYTPRDAELVLRTSVDEHQRSARILEKAISELELSGRSSKTRSLNTSEELYQWETKLVQRSINGIYGLTVRFKLMWLMRDVLKERIETSNIECKVLGDIHTSETLQRAIDLEEAGVEVRHSPAVAEMLRFIMFDKNSVLFGFRNPRDPTKHLGAWIRSEAFVEPLKLQYDGVWKKADSSDIWKKFKFDE